MGPRELIERWRMKRVCQQVRRELAFWGHDLSDMTDDELAEVRNKEIGL